MFTGRYARALLRRKKFEHGTWARLAGAIGMDADNLCRAANSSAERLRLGSKIEHYMGIRPMLLYVPVTMSPEEIEQRLSLARRGTVDYPDGPTAQRVAETA